MSARAVGAGVSALAVTVKRPGVCPTARLLAVSTRRLTLRLIALPLIQIPRAVPRRWLLIEPLLIIRARLLIAPLVPLLVLRVVLIFRLIVLRVEMRFRHAALAPIEIINSVVRIQIVAIDVVRVNVIPIDVIGIDVVSVDIVRVDVVAVVVVVAINERV